MTCVASASGASRPCRTRSSIAARKAASVLPDPVGAAMRVWRPPFIDGPASACAAVGAAKLSANQFATAGWNSVSRAVDACDAAERRRAPLRAAEVVAKSECKRLGPYWTWVEVRSPIYGAGSRFGHPCALWPRSPIAAGAVQRASVRTPDSRRAMDRAYKCSLAEYGGLRQVSRLFRREVQWSASASNSLRQTGENIYGP